MSQAFGDSVRSQLPKCHSGSASAPVRGVTQTMSDFLRRLLSGTLKHGLVRGNEQDNGDGVMNDVSVSQLPMTHSGSGDKHGGSHVI